MNRHKSKIITSVMCSVHTCSASVEFSFISICIRFYNYLILCVACVFLTWQTSHLLNEYDDDDDESGNWFLAMIICTFENCAVL